MNLSSVIINSQNLKPLTPISFKSLFETKRKLVNKFLKGNLVLEHPTPLTFTLSENSKRKKYKKFCEELTLSQEPDLCKLSSFLSHIPFDDFYNNSHQGKKVVRSFKNYISNPDLCRKIQDDASRLIQENKINGILGISAHPMDFLTASENRANWTSCYGPQGSSRVSVLNFLADSSTLIVYLREDAPDAYLPWCQTKWNNKLWRAFIHFSDNQEMVIASKQYPFSCDGILSKVQELFLNSFTTWSVNYISEYPSDRPGLNKFTFYKQHYIPISNSAGIIDLYQHTLKPKGLPYYADLADDNFYPAYAFDKKIIPTVESTYFTIGKEVKCLCCGQAPLLDPELMLCPDCMIKYSNSLDLSLFGTCAHCHKPVYKDTTKMYYDECAGKFLYLCDCCRKTLHPKECKCGLLLLNTKHNQCYLCRNKQNNRITQNIFFEEEEEKPNGNKRKYSKNKSN